MLHIMSWELNFHTSFSNNRIITSNDKNPQIMII